jgi:hypothetical protein
MTTGKQGFRFRVESIQDGKHPGWRVYLPHQCDDWEITYTNFGHGVPLPDAVAVMEEFIAEAQASLDSLRAAREFGGPR